MLAIGLMSGTSADGIDAALVELTPPEETEGRGDRNSPRRPLAPSPARTGGRWQIALRAFKTIPYPEAVRHDIFALFDPERSSTPLLCRTGYVLGELFAQAALAVAAAGGASIEAVEFIASHGQTVWHQPETESEDGVRTRSTLQIGEPAVIAERTGCTVVANFRARDIAARGQGAPFAPYVDYLLLTDSSRPRIAQNIGGIGNLTYLPPGARPEEVIAFDTGPGNAPIDAAVWLETNGKEQYDRDGRRAAQAAWDPRLLAHLLEHPYLALPPPKSTGREMFGMDWVASLRRKRAGDNELIATLTRFTVESIAAAYERWLPPLTAVTEIVLSGGGARNPTLVEWLKERVSPATVHMSDEFGLPIDAKEAMLFTVLGAETLRGAPSNLPSATGASHPVVLGQITPGRGWPTQLPPR